MKKILILLLTFLLVGCSAGVETADPSKLEIQEGLPEWMEYWRRWIYAADCSTENVEVIKQVRNIISEMELGDEVNQPIDDFTDIIIFHYEDGSTAMYEFEGPWFVAKDGTHYEIRGDLEGLRGILDELVK